MIALGRRYLFLQGPHGPFYTDLSRALVAAGARTCRIGFNHGDRMEWPERASFTPFRGTDAEWPAFLDRFLTDWGVTDLVLYGDMRGPHLAARAAGEARGLTVHCFEEGYLRPWWITYERGGVNGNSRLMNLTVADMQAAVQGLDAELPEAPARWGAEVAHALAGAWYHFHILFFNAGYPNFRAHREPGVRRELGLFARRLLMRPWISSRRRIRERRLARSGAIYHLVLLQLGHDSSMVHHSPFGSVADFIEHCMAGFAVGAPSHHRLVFKAHPFEDGREPLSRILRAATRRHGLTGRVDFIEGGKLGPLLDGARSAVTVNSTAGQQALWRGLPLSLHGASVYDKPEFVSRQPLPAFFAGPDHPDMAAYRDYRRFLLETSQVRGGFYTTRGRAVALRRLIDLMLDPADPYDRLVSLARRGLPASNVIPLPVKRGG